MLKYVQSSGFVNGNCVFNLGQPKDYSPKVWLKIVQKFNKKDSHVILCSCVWISDIICFDFNATNERLLLDIYI